MVRAVVLYSTNDIVAPFGTPGIVSIVPEFSCAQSALFFPNLPLVASTPSSGALAASSAVVGAKEPVAVLPSKFDGASIIEAARLYIVVKFWIAPFALPEIITLARATCLLVANLPIYILTAVSPVVAVIPVIVVRSKD